MNLMNFLVDEYNKFNLKRIIKKNKELRKIPHSKIKEFIFFKDYILVWVKLDNYWENGKKIEREYPYKLVFFKNGKILKDKDEILFIDFKEKEKSILGHHKCWNLYNYDFFNKIEIMLMVRDLDFSKDFSLKRNIKIHMKDNKSYKIYYVELNKDFLEEGNSQKRVLVCDDNNLNLIGQLELENNDSFSCLKTRDFIATLVTNYFKDFSYGETIYNNWKDISRQHKEQQYFFKNTII